MSANRSIQIQHPPAARATRVVLLSMFVAMAAAVATSAWAHGGAGSMAGERMGERGMGMQAHAMGGPGMAGGAGRHGAGMRGGDMMFGGSPEGMARRIDFMLDGLNASEAQRSEIKKIAQTAAADLKAQHEASRGLRQKAMQIFAAPTVDTAAAEALRKQMLAQHDQRSKRMMQTMLDVGQVLTPEQRSKLGQRLEQGRAQRQERQQRMERERPAR